MNHRDMRHALFFLAAVFGCCLLLGMASAGTARNHAAYGHDGSVLLPDPQATPGAVANETKKNLCDPKFRTGSVRDVTAAEKRMVFAEYAAVDHKGVCRDSRGKRDGCEIDHLISLELGGSNAVTNLWPQPYADHPGAHEKDVLENKLHRMVCAGQIGLKDAQRQISTNWYAAYRRYVTNALPHIF